MGAEKSLKRGSKKKEQREKEELGKTKLGDARKRRTALWKLDGKNRQP